MWSAIIEGIVSILASVFGYRRDKAARENTPEIVANTEADDRSKQQDKIQETINKASTGDEQALDDLRRNSAE